MKEAERQDFKIFIVEDDKWYGELLEYNLGLNPDYVLERYTTGKELLNNLYQRPFAITLDYSLPDMTGREVLQKMQATHPGIPVIIISAQEDIKTAVQLLKEGASDYLVKDENTHELLWNAIKRLREKAEMEEEIQHLKQEVGKKYDLEKTIKGKSPAIRKVFALVEKACRTNITVSITGETGTGKELFAKAIHYHSARSEGPFVSVNVAAIPADLIESELFGHEKGSFTGAHTRRLGKFEQAQKGTIFLDEVAEMDLNLQVKLLRVLQEREVVRIGGDKTISLDVRVITATHKDLAEEVRESRFREDLYYRLLGLPVRLPPLRERGDDVFLLAKFFMDEFAKINGLPKMGLSPEARTKLKNYSFPGNVRELKATMELAMVMASEDQVAPEDITFNAINSPMALLTEELPLREYTYRIIQHFMDKYDQNVYLIAEKLDVGKSTIYRMIKEMKESQVHE